MTVELVNLLSTEVLFLRRYRVLIESGDILFVRGTQVETIDDLQISSGSNSLYSKVAQSRLLCLRLCLPQTVALKGFQTTDCSSKIGVALNCLQVADVF